MSHFFYKSITRFIFIGFAVIVFETQSYGQVINTIAGDGTNGYSGNSGQATAAELNYPNAVCTDDSGNIYIADQTNNVVRKVSITTGIITTYAGNNSAGFSGDGAAATNAQLNGPSGVVVDSMGNLYIGDNNNGRIREVIKSTGYISTVAGGGSNAGTDGIGDGGQATDASLNAPLNIALDDSDNIYIADHYHECVRKVTVATGIITNIAGNLTLGYSGDGGIATNAELYYPEAVAVDDSGNVYIADQWNNRVRKVTKATGIITSYAGDGNSNYSGDGGAATAAELDIVSGIAVDNMGNVYIADERNNRIREVTKSTGIINTVAGDGFDQGTWNGGFSGDGGPATAAELDQPYGIYVDGCGNLYIADEDNQRIRKVTSVSDTIAVSPLSASICSGGNDTITVSGASSYQWSPAKGLSDTTGSVVIANPTVTTTYTVTGFSSCFSTTAPKTIVVTVNPAALLLAQPQSPTICNGNQIILTVPSSGTNYTWSPSIGLNATTGDTVVAYPSITTTYTVIGNNSSGCSVTGSDTITVVPVPNVPTISQRGDTLFSSAATENQWYGNGKLISGADSSYLVIGKSTDTFTVVVTNPADGCSSSSQPLVFLGINKLSINNSHVSIYPNPTNGTINITINSSVADIGNWNLRLSDVLGRIIYTRNSLEYNDEIDLSNLAGGVYFIIVANRASQEVFPVIRQ